MGNSETSLAIFYNFKEEQSCPFCKMIKDLYDIGGAKLVLNRLSVLDAENHEHNFPKCFVHHYWITELYLEEGKDRPIRKVVNEGIQIFKECKAILAI